MEKYRDFHVIGGMPEVVQTWLDTKNIEETQKNSRKYSSATKKTLLNIQTQKTTLKFQLFDNLSPVSLVKKITSSYSAKLKKVGEQKM